ncbi:MAG: hypothetical protein ACOC7L_04305 [Acidobacteriota bacterium]
MSAHRTYRFVSARSLAVVIRDRAGNVATGTAVCVEVGRHLLLATAGHVIEDVGRDRLRLVPPGERSAPPVPFLRRSCGPERPAPASDVAWLEVDRRMARERRLRFLGLHHLRPRHPARSDHVLLAHGYPRDWARVTQSLAAVQSTVGFTRPAAPRSLVRSLGPSEIALEYPPRDATGQPIAAPDPYGFSGGGVWWHPAPGTSPGRGLVGADGLRLVGLNTRWGRRSGVLFGTRIEEWLALVARDLPATRAPIDRLLGTVSDAPWAKSRPLGVANLYAGRE